MNMSRSEVRRCVAAARRWLAPGPAEAARRRLCRVAEKTPRYQSGRIRLLDYDLGYPDLLTLCPQWGDIFVQESLAFRAATSAPRILDCGANIGLATLFYKRAYPRARVTAFEADPNISTLLRENLARNGAGDVEVVHAAVWTSDGPIDFVCEGSDSGAVAALTPSIAGPSRQVPAVRLRAFLAREEIDLLKLDVEGAELAVLVDCADVLERVRAVHVEVHDFSPGRRLLPSVIDVLEGAGFTTAIGSVLPATWRLADVGTSPFPRSVATWITLVRAWR
jgi:FkbM family methyltransferase